MLSLKELGQMVVRDAEDQRYVESVFSNSKKPEASESAFCRMIAFDSLALQEKCTEELIQMSRPENDLVH